MRRALLLVALLAGCRGADRPHAHFTPEDLAPLPIPEGESVATRELSRTASASIHLTSVRGDLKPHVHRRHDEVTHCVHGSGRLRLGDTFIDVTRGTVVVIPRGTLHAFSGEATVVTTFTPPFDGKDRIFVEDEP